MVIKEAGYRVEVFVDSYAQETWDDKLTADKIEIPHACSRIGNNSDASSEQPAEVLGLRLQKFSHGEFLQTR
ncbi:hypothetical protein H8E77_13100 [bacterium]|nr:hypothetical protein [bacterium]